MHLIELGLLVHLGQLKCLVLEVRGQEVPYSRCDYTYVLQLIDTLKLCLELEALQIKVYTFNDEMANDDRRVGFNEALYKNWRPEFIAVISKMKLKHLGLDFEANPGSCDLAEKIYASQNGLISARLSGHMQADELNYRRAAVVQAVPCNELETVVSQSNGKLENICFARFSDEKRLLSWIARKAPRLKVLILPPIDTCPMKASLELAKLTQLQTLEVNIKGISLHFSVILESCTKLRTITIVDQGAVESRDYSLLPTAFSAFVERHPKRTIVCRVLRKPPTPDPAVNRLVTRLGHMIGVPFELGLAFEGPQLYFVNLPF